jgi:cytoskeleton protein RodZ
MSQSIGEQLKQARIERGLTIEQVSKATHIRKHYLEALESDQREALPSPVQGRGFLRLFAGHLDLPVAMLLAAWDGKPLPEPTVSESEPAGQQPAEDLVPEPDPILAIATAKATIAAAAIPPDDLSSDSLASSQAIFLEIGQKLQKQREGLGLSRAEVERFTRLRQHYIQALEAGQIEHLPSPVQGRGMLSNYLKFLNMDEGKVLLRFAEGLQARRIERIPKPVPGAVLTKKRPARTAPFWRRFLTPDLIFGVAVAAIILFFALWTTARISNLRTAQSMPTPPGVGGVLLTPKANRTGTLVAALTPESTVVAGETGGTATPSPTASPVNNPGQDLTPFDATQTPPGGGQANNQNNLFTLTPASNPAPTLGPINNDPLQVYIVAHRRAWLRVVADDKVKFIGRTVPGNAYAFSGTKHIELLTGNGAALQVFFNQTDLGTLGTAGQVVGLIFAPGGIVTPTPAFTVTPTSTAPATLTALPTETPRATPSITPLIP